MPTTPAIAATSTVSSKVTGMNSGQLCSGLPPELIGYEITAEYHCMK